MAFEKIAFAMKTWKDKVSGNTPITAAELNRIEKGISDTAKGVNDLGDSVYHNGGISLGTTISDVYLDADGQTFYIAYKSKNKEFVITMVATEGNIPG